MANVRRPRVVRALPEIARHLARGALAAAAASAVAACAGLFGLDPGAPGDAPPDGAMPSSDGPVLDLAEGSAPPADAAAEATVDGGPSGPGGPCDRRASPPTASFFCTGYDEEPPLPFDPTVAEGVFSLVAESPRSAPRVLRARTVPLAADPGQRSFKLDLDPSAGRLTASFALRVVEDPELDDARILAVEHDAFLYELEIRRRDGGALEVAYVANTATFKTFALARSRWVPFVVKLTKTSLDLDVDGQTVSYTFSQPAALAGLLVRWGFERAGDAGVVDFDDVRFDAR